MSHDDEGPLRSNAADEHFGVPAADPWRDELMVSNGGDAHREVGDWQSAVVGGFRALRGVTSRNTTFLMIIEMGFVRVKHCFQPRNTARIMRDAPRTPTGKLSRFL